LEPPLILIVGSLAVDDITTTADALPATNVKLTGWQTRFGGCGGNLAWNFARLRQPHRLFGYLGHDGGAYLEHLHSAGAEILGIRQLSGESTARAFITTDPDGHQFTAFRPLTVPLERFVSDLDLELGATRPDAAIIAPDVPERMLAAVRAIHGLCPLICYPGQYTKHLETAEAGEIFGAADLIFQNASEHRDLPASARNLVVVTDGANPVRILSASGHQSFPVTPARMVDPTGCGDAFTAAFTRVWLEGGSTEQAAEAAIQWAQRCLAVAGSQNH
jgi:adenosine kinase